MIASRIEVTEFGGEKVKNPHAPVVLRHDALYISEDPRIVGVAALHYADPKVLLQAPALPRNRVPVSDDRYLYRNGWTEHLAGGRTSFVAATGRDKAQCCKELKRTARYQSAPQAR